MHFKELNILLTDDDMNECIFFNQALEALTISKKIKSVYDGNQLTIHLTKNEDYLSNVLFWDINRPHKKGF